MFRVPSMRKRSDSVELSQKVQIPLPPEVVWLALNDPNILKQCLPGCETFEPDDKPHSFRLVLLAKVGPVKARFNGEVALSDIDAPNSYVLSGAGKGGVAGFAKGSAAVKLDAILIDGAPGTHMTYEANAAVGGKLAQIGSRLVDGAAKKMAGEFFTNFVRAVLNDPEREVELQTISKQG